MELEEMLEAAMTKVLAKQTEAQPNVAELVAKAVADTKAEMLKDVEAMIAKAMPVDREGTGRTSTVEAVTFESDPVAYLARKAQTIKSEDEWTDAERAVIGAAWHAVITDGMHE